MAIVRFLLIFLLSFGCQKRESKVTDSFLRLSLQSEIRSFDPRIGIDYPSAILIKMLFEGLMRIGLSGRVEPAIAERYTLSEDGKTYTFFLREASWSNGDPVTAHDFAYTWKQTIDPSTGKNLGVQNLYPIENTRAIICGEKPLDTVGIRVIDDRTLEVKLEHPTPYFLEVLATTSLLPVNARVDQENPSWARQVGTPFVCNGAFHLDRHKIHDEIVCLKNPAYWDAEHVRLPGMHFSMIKEASTQMQLFERGQLAWLGKPLGEIPLDAVEHLKKINQFRCFEVLGLYWHFLNVERFPFNNKKMRKAFAYAIDREALTQFVTPGKELPAMGVLPPGLATQERPFFADHNTALARQLFDQALDEMGISRDQIPPISLSYSTTRLHQNVAEVLQQQWQSAFGIPIRLEKQEWKIHYDNLQRGNFQIGGMYWISWIRDPIYILQTFRKKSDGVNMSHWENSEYQELLAAAEKEIDLDKRKAFFNRAEALLMEEMPVIPVYFHSLSYAKDNRLRDVYLSELYEVDFRWAYFDDTDE